MVANNYVRTLVLHYLFKYYGILVRYSRQSMSDLIKENMIFIKNGHLSNIEYNYDIISGDFQ